MSAMRMVTLPTELEEGVNEYARQHGLTRTQAVARLTERGLAEWQQEKRSRIAKLGEEAVSGRWLGRHVTRYPR